MEKEDTERKKCEKKIQHDKGYKTGGMVVVGVFFFSSRRRHTRYIGDWSSDVCSSDLFVSNPINDPPFDT